ncbi:MAG: helix-turn-helix domain-containing protein [Candidatus Saccharibacteria bacterium]
MQKNRAELAKKILTSRLYWGVVSPCFVLGILICVYYSSIKDFAVFPNAQIFNYQFYSDSTAGGNTKILHQQVSDSILKIDYQISNKITTPYAGINIGPKESKSINLGNYNQLTIKLKGDGINGIGIAMVTNNSLKGMEKKRLDILFYHIFKISPGINTYRINPDKFGVPDWWGENNRLEDASTIKPDLRNLQTINVNGAFTPDTGKPQSIEIYSMAFSRNNMPLFAWIIALELALILLVFTALYLVEKTREKRQTITITYKPIENKTIERPKSDFIDFINQNFHNSELTLEFVSGETGVSQRRITNDIQNQFACNFKTYINRLRITESKRLLLETDLNIGEIAFRVGFNNQSHFNRVFKAEMLISPTEFREKHRK